MEYTIGLAQSGYPENGDVVAQARRYASRAAEAGCQLILFPEDFMWPRGLSAKALHDMAEPVDGPFCQGVAEVMREHGLWAVFTMNESNPAGGAPFNTAVIVSDAGEIRGSYRKCHLYDALGERESDRLSPGTQLCEPVKTPFCTIGLQICYDLRFPEPARALALSGCDLLVYPAAWHAGSFKIQQWETLLCARAIENELFVAGICRAGRAFTGGSLIADPMGRVLARGTAADSGADMEDLVVCQIDSSIVQTTRRRMPLFEHRRPPLYSSLAR